MILPRRASARARALHHFQTLVSGLNGAAAVLAAIEREMRDLPKEFRARIGACDLVLYVQPSLRGTPQAVYWGRAFRHQALDGTIRRWRRHLPGRLTSRKIYLIARRYPERRLFFAFDRLRTRLNHRHRALARRLDGLRKAILHAGRRPAAPSAGALRHSDLDARFDRPEVLATAAWSVACVHASLQAAIFAHVEETRRRLPTPGLFPYATANYDQVTCGWATRATYIRDARVRVGRRHLASSLTVQVLRAFGIPGSHWRGLRTLDRGLAALRQRHEASAALIARAKRIVSRGRSGPV